MMIITVSDIATTIFTSVFSNAPRMPVAYCDVIDRELRSKEVVFAVYRRGNCMHFGNSFHVQKLFPFLCLTAVEVELHPFHHVVCRHQHTAIRTDRVKTGNTYVEIKRLSPCRLQISTYHHQNR